MRYSLEQIETFLTVMELGTVAVSVAQGATVATGTAGDETIGLLDGDANTITNAGTIRDVGTTAAVRVSFATASLPGAE